MKFNQPIQLHCQVQPYAWGCKGEDAYISKLTRQPFDATPKAELWMGAHPKASARLGAQRLSDLLDTHAEDILGKVSVVQFGKTLPYLFKVLSANEALSIQLHPNKIEAKWLHSQDPEHYPDDNHKPEIAIALDELEALVGFEAYPDLLVQLEQRPEIISFIGVPHLQALKKAHGESEKKQALKHAFAELNLKALKEKALLKELTLDVHKALSTKRHPSPKERWYLSLYPKYPDGDVGLFALFFLNYRKLSQGEAVFLKADVPHAYLKGNILECMANSDNVVRAGLTPKFVDVETLAAITQVDLAPLNLTPAEDNGLGGSYYPSPVPEFEVHLFKSGARNSLHDLSHWQGAAIGVVLKGSVSFPPSEKVFSQGNVFLVPHCIKACLQLSLMSEVAFAKPNL